MGARAGDESRAARLPVTATATDRQPCYVARPVDRRRQWESLLGFMEAICVSGKLIVVAQAPVWCWAYWGDLHM